MTDLVVRRLLIDLDTPFAARWNGGDAFRSAFFNALSQSFPAGEQYFIDAVRDGMKALPAEKRGALAADVQGFIGQEATHRRVHALFNANLERLGFDNAIERWALARRTAHEGDDLRNKVAATAATEHFTAIFADWLLHHPQALEGAEPRLRTLWEWHSAEESEHRNTAFDLYQALGGNHAWRIKVFKYISAVFLYDVLCQTLLNLWHDKALLRWSTWRSGWRLWFAPGGMVRSNVHLWKAYMAPDFHPDQQPA
ncbi:MAG: metal-dependent hydrolase, partial [Burkholderiaceae bacterium]